MNFLSITVDDMNAFAFVKEIYPGVVHTPNIDRLMAMGTTFENAFAQIAVCGASRASALSGLNPGLTGVHWNYDLWQDHLDASATFPAVLKDHGYQTTIIGKVFHNIDIDPSVVDVVADRTFSSGEEGRYNDAGLLETRPMPEGDGAHGDFLNTSEAIRVLNEAGSDPFALFLGLSKPHVGWVVPQEYFDLYPLAQIELPFVLDGDIADIPPFMQQLVEDDQHAEILDAGFWKGALQGYFASISFADAMLGRVLDTLEANGQLDDTAILMWTDHGFHLGDKDHWHKFTLWDEAARAPFVLALPGGGDDGARVEQVVELVDMMPTVLDLLGIPAPDGLSGRSLRPFLEDPALLDGGVAITTMYGSAAIRTNDYRYIRYADGSAELYDIAADPNQWTNLAAEPQWQSVRAALNAQLRTELEADGWMWVEPGTDGFGGGAAELFVLAPGLSRARGAGGDDTYFLTDARAAVVERSGNGVDTIYTSVSYTLPDHVENLKQMSRTPRQTLIGNGLDNVMVGGGALDGRGGDDFLRTNSNADVLTGGRGDDTLLSYKGNDRLFGGAGDDLLEGGIGDDLIEGGEGNDSASYALSPGRVAVRLTIAGSQDTGESGRDLLTGIENLLGSDWNDLLVGSGDANLLTGAIGDDRLVGLAGNDRLDGGDGNDLLLGGEGDDFLLGALGLDSLAGERGHDRLAGQSGDDSLSGGDGNDRLDGGASADRLVGGRGNDDLTGGTGRDRLVGGTGGDQFIFAGGDAGTSAALADRIMDFSSAQGDRLDLQQVDARVATAADDAFTFIGRKAFTGSAGELRYQAAGGYCLVQGDRNGDGKADFFIRLEDVTSLTAADLIG
jgi:arylsulfatase A-like enzyme/Ca2+-binding RTX toxin-like protein